MINSRDTSVLSSIGDDDTSEEVSKGSDLMINSRDTSVLSSIGDDDTSEEVSSSSDESADITAAAKACDLTIVSTGTTCLPPFNDTSEEVSWSSDEASDVTAASKASSGGKRKLLKRI
ncbi:unnamed protein product [Pleuronectes platessa]|uniref:Uncharacterized protein n=1 Tax=Pleuronectes platessa TaxID=8262 RepID=A0A9N7TW91_PLEPL|nr:unnamed protein product [Pleuronectes platessa]